MRESDHEVAWNQAYLTAYCQCVSDDTIRTLPELKRNQAHLENII